MYYILCLIIYVISMGFYATNFGFLMDTILNPVLIASLYLNFTGKQKINRYRGIIFALFIFVVNSVSKYILWGLQTGLMFNPDSETVMVAIYVDTVFPILLFFILIGLYKLIKYIISKRKN